MGRLFYEVIIVIGCMIETVLTRVNYINSS